VQCCIIAASKNLDFSSEMLLDCCLVTWQKIPVQYPKSGWGNLNKSKLTANTWISLRKLGVAKGEYFLLHLKAQN